MIVEKDRAVSQGPLLCDCDRKYCEAVPVFIYRREVRNAISKLLYREPSVMVGHTVGNLKMRAPMSNLPRSALATHAGTGSCYFRA